MTRNPSVWNSLRPFSVGFDSIFDEFDKMLESSERYNSNYPPYNINRVGENDYKIEVALAGFDKKDIEVEVEDGTLSIRSVKEDTSEARGEIYRGIAYRKFERKFTLADSVVVNGAKLKDGMLTINLERVVPEEKKPRTITVK